MSNGLLNIIIPIVMLVSYVVFSFKIKLPLIKKSHTLLEHKNKQSKAFKDFSEADIKLVAKEKVLGIATKFTVVPLTMTALGIFSSQTNSAFVVLICYILTTLMLIGYSALTLKRQRRQMAFNEYESNRIGLKEVHQRITQYNRESSDAMAKKVQSFGRHKEENSQDNDDFIKSHKVVSNFAVTANLIVLLQIVISGLVFII